MEITEIIIYKYIELLNEYLQHMKQSELLQNIPNSTYIICIGLNSIIHIFKIILQTTKNIDETYCHCQKSYYCYLEYIEQMNKTFTLHNLNNLDAIVFIYKNSLADFTPLKNQRSGSDLSIHGTQRGGQDMVNHINSGDDIRIRNQLSDNMEISSMMGVVRQNKMQVKMVNDELLHSILNNISFITKKILFYKNELELETEDTIMSRSTPSATMFSKTMKNENNIISGKVPSVETQTLAPHPPSEAACGINCTILQMSFIINHFMKRFFFLTIHNNNNNTFIFEYIQNMKITLKLDFQDYCELLKQIYRILKKKNPLPTEQEVNEKYIAIFINKENQRTIERLKNDKKYDEIAKMIF